MDEEILQPLMRVEKRHYKTPLVNVIYEENGLRKCKQYRDITDIVNHHEEIIADMTVEKQPNFFPAAYREA